jgi:hypothetical protein
MKRKISRSERKAIRKQFSEMRTEEKAEENNTSADTTSANDWKEAKRAEKKDRINQIRSAGRNLEEITSKELPDEVEKVLEQYFFSVGDMVEVHPPSQRREIIMEGDDEKERKIGLVIETEDYVHERYPSGKTKEISKCVYVTVLVGAAVERWNSKNVRNCE